MSAKRRVGETRDTGFQVGARRTFDVSPERAWHLLPSPAGISLWLDTRTPPDLTPGQTFELEDRIRGETRVFEPGSHLRLTWHPPSWPRPSTFQLRVIARDGRTQVALHQEHLPGPAERAARKAHFAHVLDELGSLFASG